tara:strand:- start:592 stop:1113 length:522 start_codon:yes stop_codon:yes gene_type:complete
MASIIKANQLQDFGGNSILTSDGSGNVTVNADGLKNTPAVLATKTADQSIAHNTNTQVSFDTPDIDTNNAFSSNTFTVPAGEGGMYSISARASMQGIDAGEFIQLRIYVNDVSSSFFENRQTAYTTDVEFKFSGTFSLNLSAGDTIKYYVFQNSGDAQNLSTPGLYIFKMIGA